MTLAAPASPAAQFVRHPLPRFADPIVAARWLRGEPRAVALSGTWAGGGMLLTSHPVLAASADENPLTLLDTCPVGAAAAASDVDDPVGGGWFGWLGFELAGDVETLPPPPPGAEGAPRFDLAFHDHVVRCDSQGDWWFEALWTPERAGVLHDRLSSWRRRLQSVPLPAAPISAAALRASGAGLAGHHAAVEQTVARIAAGEFSQANICLTLSADFHGDPLDLWVAAAKGSGAAYAAYVSSLHTGRTVVSLSPELFLARRGQRVVTRPIKGTAPRNQDPSELRSSAKDRAENVMIVDLMRNDLGRVCRYGSVRVDELCEVRPAAGVWHLESTVSGELRAGVHDGELLRATFPPGSVTGAPKVQALRTIHELEATARRAYCGAIGLRSPLRGLELSVAIRTFEIDDGRLWLGVGGGVVSDSSPCAEVDEALHKARGVTAAAGLRLEMAAPAATPAMASALPPINRYPRPDPRRGVFETIRVAGSRAVGLPDHLARLRRSCDQLGLRIAAGLEGDVVRLAADLVEGAIRVTVTTSGVNVAAREPPAPGETVLAPVVVPGGLGAHKWLDRDLINAHTAQGVTPLICDMDGSVLEAGYAAVIAVRQRRLLAPPTDGRILPSVSRRWTLDAAAAAGWDVTERSLALSELAQADAILLTSSLRGPHLARLAAGTALTAHARRICAELAAACGLDA